MSLQKVSWVQRSIAGECSECGGTIGCDEDCYRRKDDKENPHFVGNGSEIICSDCA